MTTPDRSFRGATAVVGAANTPFLKRGTATSSSLQLTLRAILDAAQDAGLDAHDIDGFVSYANDDNEGLAVGAALGVKEIRWSSMVWGGGGGGVAAAVNAAAAAIVAGQAETVCVYRGISEADAGRQSYSKGHIGPLYGAHGVFAPAQICALRTQRMIEVDGVPRIVSVISAKAEVNGRRVSVGTNLEAPLSEMMAMLRNGDGIAARRVPATQPTQTTGTSLLNSGSGGAKFLRP